MKKYILDLVVQRTSAPRPGYVLLQLTDPSGPLPKMMPGQFVEVRVDGSPETFLRRPISINLVDPTANELWLLIHVIGAGTKAMAQLKAGVTVNLVLPLGYGFTLSPTPHSPLLIGGGVGTAPLLYLGQELKRQGAKPTFLLGARTREDLMQLDLFLQVGDVHITTEDGSEGERGFVTQHSLWNTCNAHDYIYTCGPKPMMVAVARLAREKGIRCEASLENLMACGLGACLCCVEDTTEGHVCVCKEGPVFNIEKLKWL